MSFGSSGLGGFQLQYGSYKGQAVQPSPFHGFNPTDPQFIHTFTLNPGEYFVNVTASCCRNFVTWIDDLQLFTNQVQDKIISLKSKSLQHAGGEVMRLW